MILRYTYLHSHPAIFKAMTGLYVHEFDELLLDVQPRLAAAEKQRLSRPSRKRAIGAGHPFDLPQRDQILLTVVWLRRYPTREVLGYLFGVGEWTASRAIERVLPLLEAAGRDPVGAPQNMNLHRAIERQVRGTVDRRQLFLRDALGEAIVQQVVCIARPTRGVGAAALAGGRLRTDVRRWHRQTLIRRLTPLV